MRVSELIVRLTNCINWYGDLVRGGKSMTNTPIGVVVFKDLRYPDVVCVKMGFKEKVRDDHWPSIQRELQRIYRANFPQSLRTRLDGTKYIDKSLEYWGFVGIKDPTKALRRGHIKKEE